MGKHRKILDQIGRNKQLRRLIAHTAGSPLKFSELLVLSTLHYQVRRQASIRELACMTGLDRSTVTRNLSRLAKFGLVERVGRGWRMVMTHCPDWLVIRPAGKKPFRSPFAYNWIAEPSNDSPLSTRQAAILPALILSKGKNLRSIAKWLGVSLSTVCTVKKLYFPKWQKDWFAER